MTNQDAARILTALAAQEPAYDTLAAAYGEALAGEDLSGGELPPELPMQMLALLREDPDTAAEIERCAENLSRNQRFDISGPIVLQTVIAVLVILSARFSLKRREDGKWTFEAGFQPPNAKAALSVVLKYLGKYLGKTGDGLKELSEALGKEEEKETPETEEK